MFGNLLLMVVIEKLDDPLIEKPTTPSKLVERYLLYSPIFKYLFACRT